MISKVYKRLASDSLYRNSIFLMGSTFVVAFFGFLYWLLAAHVYDTKDVGLASTVVAVSNVVMILSVAGYDNSFIRFLPKAKNQAEQLDTGFTLSSLVAVAVSIIYLVAVHLFVPKLSFVNSSLLWMIFFVVLMVVNMLNFLNNYPFIAERITYVVLIINTGMGILRLILLFAFGSWGLNGLLLSQFIALALAMIATFYTLGRKMHYRFRPRIVLSEVKRTGKYTFNSYVSIVFLTLPTYILPTLVVSRLGTASAAYYYIVAVIIATLNVVPLATSQSLFAEGVWNAGELQRQLRNASRIIFGLSLPAIVILILAGRFILAVFGRGYANAGYGLLVILAASAIPKTLNYLISTILRIRHQVGSVATIYLVYAVIILVGSYIGIKGGHGLLTIGIATLVAEVVAVVMFAVVLYGSVRGAKAQALAE